MINLLYYFIQFERGCYALRPRSNFGIRTFERTGGGALRRKKFEQGGDEPGLNRPFADRMTGAPSTSLASITAMRIWLKYALFDVSTGEREAIKKKIGPFSADFEHCCVTF
jgi:hypothetical protein